jgi:hypothetical protein
MCKNSYIRKMKSIKMDLEQFVDSDWILLAQDKMRLRDFVSTVNNL